MALAPEIGLTPYSEEELMELCYRCTDFSKHDGWKRAVVKVLRSRRLDILSYAFKKYLRHYREIKKIRKEIYRYGYGKGTRQKFDSSEF